MHYNHLLHKKKTENGYSAPKNAELVVCYWQATKNQSHNFMHTIFLWKEAKTNPILQLSITFNVWLENPY